MIFASDLDRTLIYSRSFLTGEKGQEPVIVEYYKGEPISWMTQKAINDLKEVAAQISFVPITTRSMEQFSRIMLWESIPHKYAVTTNGANIMVNGKPDMAWNSEMKKRIENHCMHPAQVGERLNKLKDSPWMLKIREVESVFHYYVVDELTFENEPIEILKEELAPQGWNVLYNGRKIYFIPRVLEKSSALERIMEIEGCKTVLAAGDTVLDLSMAKVADRFLVPAHGDVDEMNGPNVEKLEISGMEVAEIICEQVRKCIGQKEL